MLLKNYYQILIEETKKANTGVGGAVCVDSEFEAVLRFAKEYHESELNKLSLARVSNCYSKEDLKNAWLHGCIRVPKEMKHINNFEAYYELIKK